MLRKSQEKRHDTILQKVSKHNFVCILRDHFQKKINFGKNPFKSDNTSTLAMDILSCESFENKNSKDDNDVGNIIIRRNVVRRM